MSVNGIGGGGKNVGGVGYVDPTAASQATEGTQGVSHAGRAEQAGAPTPLERLERGEITIEQYLDVRVADATQHLEGKMPASQIDFVRAALRESLASDPVLVELVRRATGSVPPTRAD